MTIDTRDDILPSPTLTPQPSFRVQTRVAHDADEQAGNLHGWNQTYDQLTAGCFVGGLTQLCVDHMQFSKSDYLGRIGADDKAD